MQEMKWLPKMTDVDENLDQLSAKALLDALRADPIFLTSQHEGLDEVLAKLGTAIGDSINDFSNQKVVVSQNNVAIFSAADEVSLAAGKQILLMFVDKNGEFLFCFGLNAQAFRTVVGSILGAGYQKHKVEVLDLLSASENVFFKLLSNRVFTAFFSIFGVMHKGNQSSECQFDELQKITDQQELTILNYTIEFQSTKMALVIIVPLEAVQPSSIFSGQQSAEQLEKLREERWKNQMASNVDELDLPVFAKLAEKDMLLIDVAKLELGSRLDFEFDLNDINFISEDFENLFIANIVINKTELLVTATRSAEHGGE